MHGEPAGQGAGGGIDLTRLRPTPLDCSFVYYAVRMSKSVSWPPSARLADRILREQGHDGLLEWGLAQRNTVIPPNWDEVARRLRDATDGEADVTGRVVRMWMLAAEQAQAEEGEQS